MKLSEFLDNKELRLAFYTLIVSVVVSFIFPILGYLHKISLDSFNLGYKSVLDISWLADFDFSGSELVKIIDIYTYTYLYVFIATVLSVFGIISMNRLPKITNEIITFKIWKRGKNFKLLGKSFYSLFLITFIRVTVCIFFFILSLTAWVVFFSKNIENIFLHIVYLLLIDFVLAIIASLILVWIFYKFINNRSNNKKSIDVFFVFTFMYTVLTIISVMVIGIYSGAYSAINMKKLVSNGDKKTITLKSYPDKAIHIIKCEGGDCIGLYLIEKTKDVKTVFFKMDDIQDFSLIEMEK